MSQSSKPFADALARHDQMAVRQAFEACNEAGSTKYDRTTLLRWNEGSVPVRGDFVRCLSERLQDPEVFSAWETARKGGSGRTSPGYESVISRFESLSQEDRVKAFPEIRRLFLARYSSIRSRMTIRVDLYDSENPDDDVFDLRVVLRWHGRLPAKANIAFVTEQQKLGDRYESDACIFRDVLQMEQEALDRMLAEGSEQTLSYRPLAEPNPVVSSFGGKRIEEVGVWEFGNDAVDDAAIRLDLRYPYPKRPQQYPIRFGQYQVSGLVEVTFALHSDSASKPQGMPFLPPGQERGWASDTLPRDELVLYIGNDETLLSEGDGVVLSWT